MTKVVDDVWWLEGVAKREVMGIFSLVPQEWWGKMEWPLRIANHVGEMDDLTWGVTWSEDGTTIKEEEAGGDVRAHIDMLAQLSKSFSSSKVPSGFLSRSPILL
jgi:hypothetical protein